MVWNISEETYDSSLFDQVLEMLSWTSFTSSGVVVKICHLLKAGSTPMKKTSALFIV